LWRAGLLTEADHDALALYCETFAAWRRAEAVVRDKGEVVKTTNGNIIQNPYLAIANRAKKDALLLMRELGMTPAARSRISVEGGGDQEPSLAELLFQRVGE
jgi:P27 family predicted phage terminase small subunit